MSSQGKRKHNNGSTPSSTEPLHLEMHRDHQRWLTEIVSWREDIVEWQSELKTILKGLAEFQKTIEAQQQTLAHELELISEFHAALATHERSIAQFEQGTTSDQMIVAARDHYEQSNRQDQLKLTHEATKRWQRSLASQWEHLHKAIFEMPSH